MQKNKNKFFLNGLKICSHSQQPRININNIVIIVVIVIIIIIIIIFIFII